MYNGSLELMYNRSLELMWNGSLGVNVEWEPGVNVEWEAGIFSLGTWILCSLVPHAYKSVTSLIGIL